jgi:hypothetical protein
MKRPISTIIVMVLAGLLFITALVGLILDPRSVLIEPRPWWRWLLDALGYVVAPVTCWTLWKKQPQARWWGLGFIGGFAVFGVFSGLHRANYTLSGGPAVEMFVTLSLLLAFAYWFGFSRKARFFFDADSAQVSSEP